MNQQLQVAKQNNKNTRFARGLLYLAGFVNVALMLMMCAASSSDGAVAAIVLLGLGIDIVVAAYSLSKGLHHEFIVAYKWGKLCKSLGGNFVGEGRKQFIANPGWTFGGPLGEWKSRTIYPKIRNVQRKSDGGFTGFIKPLYGQEISDYTKNVERIALAFKVSNVTCELAGNGLIAIHLLNENIGTRPALTLRAPGLSSQAREQRKVLHQWRVS